MNKSHVVQVGTPTEIYERPADLFVTTFIGHSNLLDATVTESTADSVGLTLGERWSVVAPPRSGITTGQRVKLVIRPENILLDGACAELASLPAVVDTRVYQGALIRYQLTAAGQSLVAEVQNQALRPQYDAGAQVTISWRPESTEVLPAD
jgi:putative spermidine/putrescine transport system ATP-binding protein